MIYYIIGYLIFHIICAIFTVGLTVGYFQIKFPIIAKEEYISDLGFGLFFGICIPSPMNIILSFFLCMKGQYGLQFLPKQD